MTTFEESIFPELAKPQDEDPFLASVFPELKKPQDATQGTNGAGSVPGMLSSRNYAESSRRTAQIAPSTSIPGLTEGGNINLLDRPRVRNSDGSVSTVRSMSFSERPGEEILIPTVSDDGRLLSDQEAIDLYHRSGRHLGKFSTVDAATAYATRLHKEQERQLEVGEPGLVPSHRGSPVFRPGEPSQMSPAEAAPNVPRVETPREPFALSPAELGKSFVRGIEGMRTSAGESIGQLGKDIEQSGSRAVETGYPIGKPIFKAQEAAGKLIQELFPPDAPPLAGKAFESGRLLGQRNLADQVAESLPTFLGSVAAMAVGGPVGGMAMIGSQEWGNQYRQSREQGATEEEAKTSATLYAGAAVALESIGAMKTLKNVFPDVSPERARTFFGRVLGSAATEGATESAQEFASQAVNLAVYAGEKGFGWEDLETLFSPENLKRYGTSGLVGAILGGGTTAVGGGVQERLAGKGEAPGVVPQAQPVAPQPKVTSVAQEPVAKEGSHAGQGGESPEAINRVARGNQYYRIRQSGEILPIPNTVDAIDVRVNPGEVKVTVSPNGSKLVDGRLNVNQLKAYNTLAYESAARQDEVEPEVDTYELDVGEGLPSESRFVEAQVKPGIAQGGFLGSSEQERLSGEFANPESEARYRAARMGTKPLTAAAKIQDGVRRAKEAVKTFGNMMSREYAEIPHGEFHAPFRESMRLVGVTPGSAVDEVSQRIDEATSNLTDDQADLFVRKTLLDNLRWSEENREGSSLPLGFTPESLALESSNIDRLVAASPEAQTAIDKMRSYWNEVRDEARQAYQSAGYPTDFLDVQGDQYLHRQVLEYAKLFGPRGQGAQVKAPKGRSFQRKMEGSEKDFNLNYAEAQGMVLTQLKIDSEVARQIANIERRYSKTKELQAKAKRLAKERGEEVSWRELIPDTHTIWQPQKGSSFYLGMSVSDRAAMRAIEEGMVTLGVEDFKQRLMVGARHREMVIPKEIASVLERQSKAIDNTVIKLLVRGNERLQRAWKVSNLLGPKRAAKYLLRNIVGDTQKTLEGNPSAIRRFPQAAKELASVIYGRQRPTGELKQFMMLGGIEAGMFQQEIEQTEKERLWRLSRSTQMGQFAEQLASSPATAFKAYFGFMRRNAKFLESVNRYANFLEYLEQIRQSPEGRPKNFGASIAEEVMAHEDPYTRAYWLSDELIGAYDMISEGGQFLRREALPFWSFQELNARSHWRLLKNAFSDDAVAAAVARKTLGRKALIAPPMLALRAGKFLGKAMALEAILAALNHGLRGDLEDDLPESIRRTPHVTLWRDSNGNVVYFSRLSVVAEVREWFGLDEAAYGISDYLNGRKTKLQVAEEMLWAPIDKLVNAIGPLGAKGVLEMATGMTTFPSARRPQPIDDRTEYVFRSFGLEDEYRAVAGRPQRTGGLNKIDAWAKTVPSAFLYSIDPGSAALSDAMTYRQQWLKRQGKERGGIYAIPEKSLALKRYKQALRYGQPQLAAQYLLEYAALGGTKDGMEQSLKYFDPMYGIKDSEEKDFLEWAGPEGGAAIKKAQEYYREILGRQLPRSEVKDIFRRGGEEWEGRRP